MQDFFHQQYYMCKLMVFCPSSSCTKKPCVMCWKVNQSWYLGARRRTSVCQWGKIYVPKLVWFRINSYHRSRSRKSIIYINNIWGSFQILSGGKGHLRRRKSFFRQTFAISIFNFSGTSGEYRTGPRTNEPLQFFCGGCTFRFDVFAKYFGPCSPSSASSDTSTPKLQYSPPAKKS